MSTEGFRFVDVFSGVGGFRRAAQLLGGTCVGAVDCCPYARRVYEANYDVDGEWSHWNDIEILAHDDVPDHDLLTAGFPCQPFSDAGNKLGTDDPRADAFVHLVRLIRQCGTPLFVLENVPGLRTVQGGAAYREILDMLTVTHEVDVVECNADRWVPQRRNRLWFVGCRRQPGAERVLRSAIDEPWHRLPLTGLRLRHALHPEDGSEPADAPYTDAGGQVDGRYYLSASTWENLLAVYQRQQVAGGECLIVRRPNGFKMYVHGSGSIVGAQVCSQRKQHVFSTRLPHSRVYHGNSLSPTLTARSHVNWTMLVDTDLRPRRLTPREIARLQGFERPRQTEFRMPVSDTRAYELLGNAVVPQAAAAVIHSALEYWGVGR